MTNAGTSALSIGAIAFQNLDPNPDGVALVGGSCAPGVTLAPSASCAMQIAFTPTREGNFQAQLRIEDVAHGFEDVAVRWHGVGDLALPSSRATQIQRRPPTKTAHRAATFRFGIEGGGVAFACKLDKNPYRPCGSPRTYRHLKPGRHVFRVKPRTAGAGISSVAAVARFRVLPRPPQRSASA